MDLQATTPKETAAEAFTFPEECAREAQCLGPEGNAQAAGGKEESSCKYTITVREQCVVRQKRRESCTQQEEERSMAPSQCLDRSGRSFTCHVDTGREKGKEARRSTCRGLASDQRRGIREDGI